MTDANSLTDTLPETVELDNLMRCPICFDHFSTAMILPNCSHNYCSLCIRKYFQFKTQCPTCGMPAADPDLRNNRVLDSIVKQFLKFRSILNEIPTEQGSSGMTLNSPVTMSGFFTSKSSPSKVYENKTAKSKKSSMKTLPIAISDDELSYVQEDETKTTGNSSKNMDGSDSSVTVELTENVQLTKCTNDRDTHDNLETIGKCGQPENVSVTVNRTEKTTSIGSPASHNQKVACPVCGVPVKECYVNLHLDRCLREDGHQKVTKRKPLTKLVYNLMSDKELKKKLKELGLSVQGDRQILIKRHREFLMFYNADGDSLNPKPLSVLVQEFEKMENMKNKMSKRTNELSVAVKKGSKPEEIRKAQKQYVKKHNSQYSKLMADVKIRLAETKCSIPNPIDSNDSNVEVNNKDAEKLLVCEDTYPPSKCDESAGMALVSGDMSSYKNRSRITTDMVDESSMKSTSENVEDVTDLKLKPVCIMPNQSSFSEKEHGEGTSLKKGPCSVLITERHESKIEIDSLTDHNPSGTETDRLPVEVSVSAKSLESQIPNDSTTPSLTDHLPDKKVSYLNNKIIGNHTQLANKHTNSEVILSSVHQLATSAESPDQSSPRKQLFSPNTAGIVCDIVMPDAGHDRTTFVEDSDHEEVNEISFMDSITESIDLFGSESILDSSAVIKDVWPALSQKSVSTPCDLVSHSDQETDTLPNGQKQDEVMSSDSDILECANDDIQVTSDLSICTRGQKNKSRVSTIRRSGRCKKRKSEHALENTNPKRKQRK